MTDTVLSINPRVRFRAVGDEGVLVHLDSGRVIVVNDVGLFLVEQLQQAQSSKQLCQAIVESFDVSPEQAQQDLDEYLAAMDAEHMLQRAPAAA